MSTFDAQAMPQSAPRRLRLRHGIAADLIAVLVAVTAAIRAS